jgi:hypothetical protein
MINVNVTNIPKSSAKIIDSNGFVTREWYLFFLNLFTLVGNGSNSQSVSDLQLGPLNSESSQTVFESIGPPVNDFSQIVPQFINPSIEQANFDQLLQLSQLTAMPLQLGTVSSYNYDSGSWSPSFTGSTTDPAVTYVTQNGNYIRLGNVVVCTVQISWSAFAGGSGDLWISLPFKVSSGVPAGPISKADGIVVPGTATLIAGKGIVGQLLLQINALDPAGTSVQINITDVGAVGVLQLSMTYITD